MMRQAPKAQEKQKPLVSRFGLRGYLFFCFGCVAALPVLVLGIIQAPRWEAIRIDEINREGHFVAQALVHGIGEVVEGHVRAVETLAGQVQVRNTLELEVLQKMVKAYRMRYAGFSFMYVAGIDGVSIVAEPQYRASGEPTAGTDYSSRDYYKALLATQKTAISRVQIGKNSGVPNIQIAAPIWDDDRNMVAFAEGSLDLSTVQRVVERITKGISGLKVIVLDHVGRVIVHPDATVQKAVADFSHLSLFQTTKGARPEIHTGVDEHGVPIRASVSTVDHYGFGWTVVVYRPQSEIQTEGRIARNDVLIIAGMALLAGLSLATILAANLSRPILKLAAIATQVGRGNFSHLPEMPNRWIPREMGELQAQLRGMVSQLKIYTNELEQKISERTEELKKANQEIESFVYSVSHDLKAPVISLYGMATMLKKQLGMPIDQKVEHYLQRILSNAVFMEQLITDLLDFSRMGKSAFKMEILDTDQLVSEVLKQCDKQIREKQAKIKIKRPLPILVFDYTSLCQIFLNFVGNALKFTAPQKTSVIEIGGRESDDYIEFYVTDNGIGIDAKHSKAIFGVFHRLKEVDVAGTGIGLAVVKRLIDQAGGEVWFESEKGRGTTFFFRIPKIPNVPTVSGLERE